MSVIEWKQVQVVVSRKQLQCMEKTHLYTQLVYTYSVLFYLSLLSKNLVFLVCIYKSKTTTNINRVFNEI